MRRGEKMLNTDNNIMLHEAKKAKHKPHIILQILIFIAVFLVANITTGIIFGIPIGIMLFKNIEFSSLDLNSYTLAISGLISELPEWSQSLTLFSTIITTFFAILYCRCIEQRSLVSMGMGKTGFFKKYGISYLVGVLMIGVAVGLSVLLGGARFTGFNAGVSPAYIILFFLGFIVQGMSEEVMVRGYFMISCANKIHIAAAVLISSAVFAALHLLNPGITVIAFINLMLFGIFAAVYILRTDDIWGACAIHSAWNFFQGNIFGISVSGGGAGSSVFGTAFNEGHELISGGSFGIEGGICTTIVMTAGIILTLYLPQKPKAAILQDENDLDGVGAVHESLPLYIKK